MSTMKFGTITLYIFNMALSIMTLSTLTFNITTLIIMTFGAMTYDNITRYERKDNRHNDTEHI
jgi:hypothetical protein